MKLDEVAPLTISMDDRIYLQYLANRTDEEVCGVVYVDGRIVELPNTFCGDKHRGFDMEIDLEDDIAAIWHSHPNGLTRPSEDDMPCINLLAEHGFNFHYLIVTEFAVHEYEAIS